MDFILRTWQETDASSLAKYANNYNIAKNLTNQFPHPYTIENAKQFIAMAMSKTPNHIFCIDINSEAIGGIGVHPQQDVQCKNAELGYWLAEPFWNNGIISKAIPKVIDYGFKTFNINRIFARPYGTNVASQKVLEKCGFILEARFEKTFYKNDEYQDELIYAIRV
ncbi:MAG: GNAT family protein [Bacteroidetes bacterium]|nr:GNAT family protein [Bacteroidota bacterium]